ncbi:hypothetical protein BC835DRAFT_1307430 [Cytidiella melzeri]|nr:hypothetical protein BC835DRAFT_1307430 [Cytidiella melzeri]
MWWPARRKELEVRAKGQTKVEEWREGCGKKGEVGDKQTAPRGTSGASTTRGIVRGRHSLKFAALVTSNPFPSIVPVLAVIPVAATVSIALVVVVVLFLLCCFGSAPCQPGIAAYRHRVWWWFEALQPEHMLQSGQWTPVPMGQAGQLVLGDSLSDTFLNGCQVAIVHVAWRFDKGVNLLVKQEGARRQQEVP